MTGRFNGKTAIVTGSGQSIGRSIALLLAREGANVVVNSRSEVSRDDTPTARSTYEEILAAGGSAAVVYADVGDMSAARRVFDEAETRFGGVDIMINNAGGGMQMKSLEDIEESEWDSLLNSNLKSQFAFSKFVLPGMKARGWGRIINIGSPVGLTGLPRFGPYAASKAGSMGLTMALAHELAGTGVTANCVLPSAATTRNNRDRAKRAAETGLQVTVAPERDSDAVAPLLAWLATDGAAGINGQHFTISAGTIWHHRWPPTEQILIREGRWTLDELALAAPMAFGGAHGPAMPRG